MNSRRTILASCCVAALTLAACGKEDVADKNNGENNSSAADMSSGADMSTPEDMPALVDMGDPGDMPAQGDMPAGEDMPADMTEDMTADMGAPQDMAPAEDMAAALDPRFACDAEAIATPPRELTLAGGISLTVEQEDAVCIGEPLRPSSNAHASFFWQGLHFEWERTVAGFQTPHRVGDLASLLLFQRHITSPAQWRAEAEALFRFEPGVDGDKAEPVTYYSGAYSQRMAASRGKATISVTDDVGQSDPPEARTTARARVQLDLDRADLGRGQLDNYTAVMTGFGVRTRCDDAKQPAGEECNSNGFWPVRMGFGLESCQVEQVNGAPALECELIVDVWRGWTPTNGGGKPLNTSLDVTAEVHFAILGGDDEDFVATPLDLVEAEAKIRQGAQTGQLAAAGSPNMAHATMALQYVDVELLETGINQKRGRYMTYLDFRVQDGEYVPSSGSMQYDWSMGFKAPSTVVNSDARYRMRPVLLQFGEGAWPMEPGEISTELCFSGFAFNCDNQGIPERTVVTEMLSVVTAAP